MTKSVSKNQGVRIEICFAYLKRLTLPLFLFMITDIRLSLRSLSSFFWRSFSALCLSFSDSRAASLALCASLASSLAASLASECKLRLELDLSKEGNPPRLSIEDFLCVAPGVEVDTELSS